MSDQMEFFKATTTSSLSCSNKIRKYDVDTNKWNSNYFIDQDQRRMDHSVAFVGDKLWIIGGFICEMEKDTGDILQFDYENKQLTKIDTLPITVANPACTTVSKIHNGPIFLLRS